MMVERAGEEKVKVKEMGNLMNKFVHISKNGPLLYMTMLVNRVPMPIPMWNLDP